MLKIDVIKFEAQDIITASLPNPNRPDDPDVPEDLEYCICPQFNCGSGNTEVFSHNPGCTCDTNAHWWAE